MHASFHVCGSLGQQSCCQEGGGGAPTEVIHASEPSFPADTHDTEPGDTTNVQDRLSSRKPSDLPEELQEEPSGMSAAQIRLRDQRQMESDFEIMRAIPVHRALRQRELWTSPHEIRRRNRAAQVWNLSTKVSGYDVFLSHTWRSVKGWQKVLALILQLGWLHGLMGWLVGMTAMFFLQEFEILPDPDSANYIVPGRTVTCKTNPYFLVVVQVSLVVGLWSSTYLPCRRKMCFLDVACIHQGDHDLFERGIYGIGGCLSVTKELRILYSPDYLSSLWCIFELVGFRHGNPRGELNFAPLFIEQSVAICCLSQWCISLVKHWVVIYADDDDRQRNFVWLYVAIFLLPYIFIVHALRRSYRDKARLISDLQAFRVDDLVCYSDFDRSFILSAIDQWYGHRDAFHKFVRNDLREELMGLLPLPHLHPAYAALIVSADAAWMGDILASLPKAGVTEVMDYLRLFFAWSSYCYCWLWFGFNGMLYLSDKGAPLSRTRALDWSKSVAVAVVTVLWAVAGNYLTALVMRSTSLAALVCWCAFCMLLPCLAWMSAKLGGQTDGGRFCCQPCSGKFAP